MDAVYCLQLPVDRVVVVVITYSLFLHLIQENLSQTVTVLILIWKVSLSNLGYDIG